jgi:DNA-directed RNA polymerase subunit K/omega
MTETSKIVTFNEINKNYDPSKNVSVKFMTIYEKTSILGLRKQQLANGAQSYLDSKLLNNVKDIEEIAHLELKHKKLPFLICRSFNNEYKEYWKIEDLIIL